MITTEYPYFGIGVVYCHCLPLNVVVGESSTVTVPLLFNLFCVILKIEQGYQIISISETIF